ncbi:MAG: bifunctional nuclease family protein [Candidatus Latescibacteria bacterium]|nr:bifunctional nuclease family protein [Candidatus Latescibacterota bacterium]NIM21115.1 bifunctional nuclease family protein [Candidatus Latescibacterota bacterium]NIM65250.1 bifunctional nuclease family protein [Candidatus Latescibacterota bacterium]NIO01765.1 bifunctional nuclease family protein [Candidatus Latescibacterota bacterium]NIO28282.1 bifunctional nuclease family protein [Candidatus Latescibacterota bacterium]
MQDEEKSFLKVEIRGLTEDHRGNPVVLLKSSDDDEVLPIWIGHAEAMAIRLQLEGESFDRPLTLDLLRTTVESLGATVLKVAVTELRDNTFFAKIHLQRGEEIHVIDARPSDSIALALRTKSPIYVSTEVFENHKRALHDAGGADQDSDDELRRYLRDLDPGEF